MRRVGALILAAGGSTRFGEPKQFLEFEGETLIRRVVNAAQDAGCAPIVVVAGDSIERMRNELSACEVIHNREWQRGIGTSIKRGVAELRKRVDAIVILACDQPLVSSHIIRELVSRDTAIAASSYANTVGVPALFDSSYFDALAMLADNEGAKNLIQRHRADAAIVRFDEGAVDIDTRADYELAIRSSRRGREAEPR